MNVRAIDQLWQRRNIWVLTAVGIIAVGIPVVGARSFLQSQDTTAEEVAPPPQRVEVVALGRIEPEGEVINVSSGINDVVSRVLVSEGDTVQAGDIVAYLDSYEERLTERDFAASQLRETQAQLQTEIETGEATIAEAQTRLEQIDRPQTFQMKSQAANVKRLEAQLDLAKIDLERFQALQGEGALAKQELDRQSTEVRQLEEELNSAKATLVQLETSRDTNMQNAEAQVRSAQADLARSKAKVQVESAARNLAMAEATLERTIVRAPRAGQILDINTKPGELLSGFNNESIVALGDTSQMYVVAEVYETDVGLVKLGQAAKVTSRNGAFDETLTGTVAEVGRRVFKNNVLDDDPAADADSRVVEVKVRLDESEAVAALTNLQVDVRIEVD
ncbi:MAG: HlyD family efflux transporter periplasmic adaptor subunit [Cyanothece sp. SIO1E1]|nr:HlyD family efflux transporter periplasmic adaptor subunit [Cyanothece sp. SIO1E1]